MFAVRKHNPGSMEGKSWQPWCLLNRIGKEREEVDSGRRRDKGSGVGKAGTKSRTFGRSSRGTAEGTG
eukprot:281539-Rhodomonas_salina.2